MLVLILADLVLASAAHWAVLLVGVALWGLHMGATQSLLATMVAGAAPADLRATAFGFFNLFAGIAMLLASVLAGVVWDYAGPAATFLAGAVFAAFALLALAARSSAAPPAATR
jgi:MFS family permease